MNNLFKYLITLMLIIVFILALSLNCNYDYCNNFTEKNMKTWIWNTKIIKTNFIEQLEFMKANNCGTVFLYIDYNIKKKYYQNFVQKASLANIEVQALNGDPSWVNNSKNQSCKKFFFWYKEYQKISPKNQRFKGIHFDVEPYLNGKWHSEQNYIIENFQSFILYTVSKSKDLNLKANFDVPFWYDEISYKNKYGTGNLNKWLIKHCNYITIMAYRNNAKTVNEIVKNELKYANKLNRKVNIGLEIENSKEGDHISFCRTKNKFFQSQIKAIHQQYKNYPSYDGISIHSLKGWINYYAKN